MSSLWDQWTNGTGWFAPLVRPDAPLAQQDHVESKSADTRPVPKPAPPKRPTFAQVRSRQYLYPVNYAHLNKQRMSSAVSMTLFRSGASGYSNDAPEVEEVDEATLHVPADQEVAKTS